MTRRIYRRRLPSWFWLAAVLALAVGYRWSTAPRDDTMPVAEGWAQAIDVVDGYTLLVSPADDSGGAAVSVRLIGITKPHNPAAVQWLRDRVVNQQIRIDLDKRRRDADGTSLAYVYLDDTLLNAELIQRGWATHRPYPGDSTSHAKLLRDATP